MDNNELQSELWLWFQKATDEERYEALKENREMIESMKRTINYQIEVAHDALGREEVTQTKLNEEKIAGAERELVLINQVKDYESCIAKLKEELSMTPAVAIMKQASSCESAAALQLFTTAKMIEAVQNIKLIQGLDLFDLVSQFQVKFGHYYAGKPRLLDKETFKLKADHLVEELEEYGKAHNSGDIEGCLDALVDLVYVALGTAYASGFNFNEAFRRVHEANMRKERATDTKQSKRGSKLDIIKPKGWMPAFLGDLVK